MLDGRIRGLFRRGVPQLIGLYIGGAWALLQFVDWATSRYSLPPGLTTVVLILAVALLPIAVLVALRRGVAGLEIRGGLAASSAEAGSVAVLPFTEIGVQDEPFLGDGISDEIISALDHVEGLRVASRTSSHAFKGRNADVRTIARELNVRTVLEGSVQRSADRLRVSARLVDAAEGFQLWSERWDSEPTDLFAIEDQIASAVARALGALLRGDRNSPPRVRRAHLLAYEYYLRGRQYFFQTRRKSLGFAREMFERAIEVDPGYALAHAALADTFCLERTYYLAGDVDLDAADRASLRALELDPGLAEAHSSRAFVLFLTGRHDEAEREFRAAIRLAPRLFEAHYFFGRMRFQQGRFEEAAHMFETADRLRDDYQAAFFAAQSHQALGDASKARSGYRRALAVAEKHMEFNPDDARAATMRAVSLCRLGNVGEGLEWAERAVSLDPHDASVAYNVACLYAVAGKPETALRHLERAAAVGFGNADWIGRDPDMAALKDDPRFQALLDRMRLEPQVNREERRR